MPAKRRSSATFTGTTCGTRGRAGTCRTALRFAVLQELGGWRDLKMVLRYAHLAPGHLVPYAGNNGLAKPQDVDIDQAQNRTNDVRLKTMKNANSYRKKVPRSGVADGVRTHDNRNHNPEPGMLS